MKKTKTRTIVRCALIASLYTAVSLVLAPHRLWRRTGPCERGLHAAARACAGRRCGRHAGLFPHEPCGRVYRGKRAGRAGHRIRYRRHAHCRAVYAPPCPCAPQGPARGRGCAACAHQRRCRGRRACVGVRPAHLCGLFCFRPAVLHWGSSSPASRWACRWCASLKKTPALRAWFRD